MLYEDDSLPSGQQPNNQLFDHDDDRIYELMERFRHEHPSDIVRSGGPRRLAGSRTIARRISPRNRARRK